MRPPRHQESQTSEARDSCCLPARRLWNLDLPPPTSPQNVPLSAPGITTPAISLLSFPSQLPDPSIGSSAHLLDFFRNLTTPRSSRPFQLTQPQTHPATDSPIVLSFFTQPPANPNLHALNTFTQPPDTPTQPPLNLSVPCYFLAPSLLSQILISHHQPLLFLSPEPLI